MWISKDFLDKQSGFYGGPKEDNQICILNSIINMDLVFEIFLDAQIEKFTWIFFLQIFGDGNKSRF